MNLTDIIIVGSIITGLLSIPFLATNSYSDYIPAGKAILGINETDVTKIPARASKTLSFDRFERTYETAFGKFYFMMAPDNIVQELSRPGTTVKVIATSDKSIWQLTTHKYMLKITQDPDKTIEEFSNADGSIIRVKQNGGINETFQGFNPELLQADMQTARVMLENEVNKMEQIKLQTVLPEIGVLNNQIMPQNNNNNGGQANGQTYTVRINSISYTTEWVEIVNTGEEPVSMGGWTLQDASSNVYTFPTGFTLNPGSTVRIYSGSAYSTCTNSQTSLCWKASSIWNDSGDTATLKDASGNTVSTYSYP
ncbi:MAG: lamin tail domain-containing protein [Candidatus Aenigmarchaeota archaeon]|nr:lamin tail domain-containing protein [Candidatus Aenigmarchaeota archaeon]